MNISDRIFETLKNSNISQKEFSKMTGIAESTICDWKRKGLNPAADKLSTICRALKVSPDFLLGINKADYSINEAKIGNIIVESTSGNPAKDVSRLGAYSGLGKPTIIDSDSDLYAKKVLVKRLRKLARLDRITLDESQHTSGLNKHLLKYLDYVGIDKLSFIKNYILTLQPFMVEELKSQENFENAICVLDEYYRISIYIKMDATQGEEVIVSFHENNKNGVARQNNTSVRNGYVYVFADSLGAHVVNSNTYSINLFITRGIRSFPINVAATKYDDEGFWVRYSDINNSLVEIMNHYLEDLYTADLDYSEIRRFSSLQELSFTSYGNDVFSNISLLMDSLIVQKDALSKAIADAALCIYCSTVSLTEVDKAELIDTLQERFRVNSIRILPEIVERIRLNLSAE